MIDKTEESFVTVRNIEITYVIKYSINKIQIPISLNVAVLQRKVPLCQIAYLR